MNGLCRSLHLRYQGVRTSPENVMTECLAITNDSLAKAVDLLRCGQLVAFPTETVYGLGADACDAAAVASIFAAKKRPSFNPLISHVADRSLAFDLGLETPIASALATAFWPGPLTLILHRKPDCPIASLTSAGLDKIAIRVPAHDGARALLLQFGGPVAAPSANPSGRISPSRAEHVMALMAGDIPLVLDGGACISGLESTVIDCTGADAVILRPGGVTRAMAEDALRTAGITVDVVDAPPIGTGQSPASPGQLESHYAPQNTVRLNATSFKEGECFIGFGGMQLDGNALNLSPSADLVEAAANLFDMLHIADGQCKAGIAVAPIPALGLGEAINDRLQRAAAPR